MQRLEERGVPRRGSSSLQLLKQSLENLLFGHGTVGGLFHFLALLLQSCDSRFDLLRETLDGCSCTSR